jgi:phospholipase C
VSCGSEKVFYLEKISNTSWQSHPSEDTFQKTCHADTALRKRFPQIGGPLTARDANALDLDEVLTLPKPDNVGPTNIQAQPYAPSVQTAAARQTQLLNGMQKALVHLAANFPKASGKDLQAHLAGLKAQGLKPPPPGTTNDVLAARTYVKKQVGNLFQAR